MEQQDLVRQAVKKMSTDPRLMEQVEAAAKMVGGMIGDSKVRDKLDNFGEQLKDPKLQEKLEAMMADPHFQEQASLVQKQIEEMQAAAPSLLQVKEGAKKETKDAKKQLKADSNLQKTIEAMR